MASLISVQSFSDGYYFKPIIADLALRMAHTHWPHHMSPAATILTVLYSRLKSTGRGKHIGPFSYYHMELVSRIPEAVARLTAVRMVADVGKQQFNVVKLDSARRISFLLYADFDVPFPALLASVSCNLDRGSIRHTDYARRRNPPILHRKELLLPQDHPLVPEAVDLTKRLEQLGAFVDTAPIGTRLGWQRRLNELGLDGTGRPST